MIDNHRPTEAGQQYTAAHDAHYTKKDMHKAFGLYRRIIADYPNTKEAGYSLSQVQNIVDTVVPKQEVLDALAVMTIAHLESDVPTNLKAASDTPLAS
jgi:hypothetical protein